MRGRDDNLALRTLVTIAETHTQFLRTLDHKLDDVLAGLDGITTRLDEFHAEFATHRHGDDGEVL